MYSRVVALVLLVLALSMVTVQGIATPYPVVVSLNGAERVLFVNHASDLENGNWIELSGGTTVELPSMSFEYVGPDIDYSIGNLRVKMDSGIIPDLIYPLDTHQIYNAGDLVSAKFWGSPEFGDEKVHFLLVSASSPSEIKKVLEDPTWWNIFNLVNILEEWDTFVLSSGDGTFEFYAPAAGDYILAVARLDSGKVYLYSATPVEVVDYTLGVSVASSVEQGHTLNVISTLDSSSDSYTHVVAMIKKSEYKGNILLETAGNIPNTKLYLNGEIMVEGALFTDFYTAIMDQSDLTVDLIEEKLRKAFGSIAFGHITATQTGTISLSTSSLSTGEYVLLVGVWKDFDSRIVGVYEQSVSVVAPYEPEPDDDDDDRPPRPSNKPPVADAGPNVKIPVGSTIHFSGAGSYDPDGDIVRWTWSFGDGGKATGEKVSHSYSEPGHYKVTLVVKDNKGAEDSDKCEVMVWEWPAPVADKFGQLVPGEQKGFKVDGGDETNTIVTLDTISQVTVTILKYEDNPHPDDPLPATALPLYVDVEVSDPDAVEWPIYVEMFYTDEEIGDLDESTFGIYYWMNGAWQRCSHTGVDMERNVVWAYMTALEASGSPILMAGLHEMITPPLPPFLDNFVITPEEVELGEDITISLDIMNPNNQSIIYYARIKVGEISILVDIELDAYETKTVTHTLTPLAEGIIDVIVDGLTGSFTVIVSPPLPTPAEFVVSDLMVLPTDIEEGYTVMISVTVTNIGEAEGSYTVEFKVDGETVESETVTILGDSVYYSIFEKTWSAGTYIVSVEELTADFTVSALPEPDFTIYYLVGLIIVVAIVLYYLWRQKLPPFDQAV